jgi:hypothetical protein
MPQPLLSILNIIVANCRMGRNAIIPQTNSGIIPLDPYLNILTLGYVFEKQLEKGLGFLVFEADDSFGKARVDEECFLACSLNYLLEVNAGAGEKKSKAYGVNANDWVLRFDWLSAYKFPISPRAFGLWEPAMLSSQPFQ